MHLIWSREEQENLADIEDFIARDSLERAVRFVDALIDHAEDNLPTNPRSGLKHEKYTIDLFYGSPTPGN